MFLETGYVYHIKNEYFEFAKDKKTHEKSRKWEYKTYIFLYKKY